MVALMRMGVCHSWEAIGVRQALPCWGAISQSTDSI
jgi:hypothetical protein